jgi:hypothetical protein
MANRIARDDVHLNAALPETSALPLRKPIVSLIAVTLLCSPVVAHIALALASQERNSAGWLLDALPVFTLLASLPIAAIVALVATIRHRAPVWSLIAMWMILALSTLALFLMKPRNPLGG